MKRNMDLIRLLLLRSEGDEEAATACEQFSVEERAYHARLMVDAGLIEATIICDQQNVPSGAIIHRLTWNGHEFLELARQLSIWSKAKAMVMNNAVSWSFELLKLWLSRQAELSLNQ